MTYRRNNTAPSPRFSATDAAANFGFSHDDLLRGLQWARDTASDNDFAASIVSQIARGLTERQWRAVARAGADATSASTTSTTTSDDNATTTAGKPAPAFKNKRVSLSPVDRSKARRAISTAPGWPTYSKSTGINASTLSGDTLFAAADALQVDIAAAIGAINAAARKTGTRAFAAIGDGSEPNPASMTMTKQLMRDIARAEANAIYADKVKPVIVERVIYQKADGTKAAIDEVTHPQFANLLAAANCRDFSGAHINVFLVGPTGTGKSFAAEQLAKLLGLKAYFHSAAIEGYDLVGYVMAHNGQLKETPFVQAFRNGGVCLLDEVDRYEPKATVALNSALANGRITLGNGEVIKRHKDFICIASGNTFGFGATADFTAAEKMDLSTISRFPVRLDWHIHSETEDKIAAAFSDDASVAAAWLQECRAAREAMERTAGLPYLADQRCVEAGANLLAAGMDADTVRSLTYLAPLDADQRSAVLSLVRASGKMVSTAKA